MTEGRVDLVAEADYSAGSHLEKEIKGAISRMADLKN